MGSGLASLGLRNLGTAIIGMEKHETLPPGVWASSWNTRASLCGALPHCPKNDDGEDYMTGLAEEIAQCMHEENEKCSKGFDCSGRKPSDFAWTAQAYLSTSPQSTLAGMSSWDLLSSGASSNGGISSGVSSPPTPVASAQSMNEEDDALDLLYAELLRLKVEDEIKARQQHLFQLKQQQYYQQLLWKMRQRQAAALSYEAIDAHAHKLLQGGTAQFSTYSATQQVSNDSSLYLNSKLRTEEGSQVYARKQCSSGWGGNQNQGSRQRNWPATENNYQGQAQQVAYAPRGSQHKTVSGSGMRAVFLGNPGARESGGTGVFLPRRLGSGHDSRRKPSCSTVLLPSRIVQALNLNVQDTLVTNPSPTGVFHRRDSVAARSGCPSLSGEVTECVGEWVAHPASACPPLQEVAPDICLPTEWTY